MLLRLTVYNPSGETYAGQGQAWSLKAVDHYSDIKQDSHNVGQDQREEYAKEQ